MIRLFAVLFTVVFLFSSSAQSEEKPFLPIQALKTSSGIPIWLVEDHTIPVLSVQIAFKDAGAKNDTPEKQGLMRLLSNTLDEGAGDLTSEQFQKVLADESISLSFTSSKDDFFVNLYTLSEKRDLAFDLLSKALTSPRFDAEPLARMTEANAARIRSSLSDPDWIAARIMNDTYFKSHPYGLNSGGTLTTLASITAQDLISAKNKFLTQDKIIVAITGDIKAPDAIKLVDKTFGSLENKNDVQNTLSPFVSSAPSALWHFTKDIPQSVITMQGPGIDRDDPDYDAAVLANLIFGGGGFGSRLTQEIREKRGLTYGIYSSLSDQDLAETVSITVSTKTSEVKTVLDLIESEQNKFISTDVTQQELEDAKSYLIGSMPLSLTSSTEISALMIGQMLDNKPIDDLDKRTARIQAVTIKDIRRVALRLFKPAFFTTVIIGKKIDTIPRLKTISTLPNVE